MYGSVSDLRLLCVVQTLKTVQITTTTPPPTTTKPPVTTTTTTAAPVPPTPEVTVLPSKIICLLYRQCRWSVSLACIHVDVLHDILSRRGAFSV